MTEERKIIPELEQAKKFHMQNKTAQAEQHYIQALAADPDNPEALYLLGTLYAFKGVHSLAVQLLKRAVDGNHNYYEAWNNIGNCYKAFNDDVKARFCWEKCLTIEGRKPIEYSDIYNNLATLYVNAGCPEEGMKFAEQSVFLNPEHSDGNWNLALLLLEQGKYGEGFDRYKWGYKNHIRLYRAYGDKVVDWDGSPDKTIVVWGEQGIGDEILFSSMIPDLMKISKKVIFECHPRLVKIFKESFPGIVIYGTRKDAYINWHEQHPDMDAKVAIGDLGRFFRRDLSKFPDRMSYLKASQERIDHYRRKLRKLGNRLNVGISWTGGYMKTRKDYRSIDLDQWKPILKQDCNFISLQYTPDAYNPISEIEDKYDIRVHHWPSAVQADDYHETAALVSSLDLVITVNTAVHHLAGALGKKCWTLTPAAHAWRYWSPDQDGGSIPWYPSCRQFMQKKLYEWKPIISQVADELRELRKSKPEEPEHEDQLCDNGGSVNGELQVSRAIASAGTGETRTYSDDFKLSRV